MLCTAELLLGETVVAAGSCMLDTGALEASFISQSMIDSSPLFTPLLTPCSIAVTLGDGKEEKGVYVTSYIQLTVRIPDSRGTPYTASSIWLLVMPALTVDIVIGLPHLMRCFAGCFMSRLNSAIVAAHEAYVDSPPGPPSSHVPITPIAALHSQHVSFRQSNAPKLQLPQPVLAAAGDRSVTVLSLNCNGFVSAVSKGIMGYLADRADSHDVLLLQEVKLVPARHAKARQQLTDAGYISVTINCIGGMNGVLIAVRPTLTPPMYLCDFPIPDLHDSRGRVLTAVFSDPPLTIVCAYLPFQNPKTEGIVQRCLQFRDHFTRYIVDLVNEGSARQRSVILAGDLQVAPSVLDESITLRPPGPGSTTSERVAHASLLSKGSLIDAYRHLMPDQPGYTCQSTYPGWLNKPYGIAYKRIDVILSPLTPIQNQIPLVDTLAYNFSDHAAISATYIIPSSSTRPEDMTRIASTAGTLPDSFREPSHPPSLNTNETEEGRGADTTVSLAVLLSDKDRLINDILKGRVTPFKGVPDVPEDKHTPPGKGIPALWDAMLEGLTLTDSHTAYVDQIPHQVDDWIRGDEAFMKILLGHKALRTFGEPLDGQGISGIPLLHIDFDPSIPSSHRAMCRNVPQQIRDVIEDKLYTYKDRGLFEDSYNPLYCSPIVIAKKATTPFFRIAIDYRWVNQYVRMIQAFTPVILDELYKAGEWEFFGDIDMTEAFHQVKLDEETSRMLTIITTIGPIKPRFMMEGVAPASSVLQNTVTTLFESIRSTSICIFDNILTGGDKTSLRLRVSAVLDLCYKHNIRLNFKKTFLGFKKAKYFGYELFKGGYRIDESRKAALKSIPFPETTNTKKANTTAMKSFLGFTVYFCTFVEGYARYAAPLHDMTRVEFSWDETTWTRDYRKDFETFKEALYTAMDLIYPDFDLTWLLLTDASDFAVGWMLIQLRPTVNGILTEVISLGSEKFSTQAELAWPINEKEAYGVLIGVEKCSRLLMFKPFYIVTDHFNLCYLEQTKNKKLSRYLLAISQTPCIGQLPLSGSLNPADLLTRKDPRPAREYLQSLRESAVPVRTETTLPTKATPVTLASFTITSTPEYPFERAYESASINDIFTDLSFESLVAPCTSLTALSISSAAGTNRDSSQMFQFKIDGEIAFEGRLQSTPCSAHTASGPCKNRAVHTATICWVHLLQRNHLRVRDSEYGKGLFAQQQGLGPRDPVFKKDQTIIHYGGQEITLKTLEERYGNHTAPYAVIKRSGKAEDAALLRSAGGHANHRARPNARFGVNNGNLVTLIASANIYNGQEIFLNYNRASGAQYRFNEPGVSHSTGRVRLGAIHSADIEPDAQHFTSPNPAVPVHTRAHRSPTVQYSEAARRQIFDEVHGGPAGHFGGGKTWLKLNQLYPGHCMPYKQVQTLVDQCPHCQKYRIRKSDLVIRPLATVIEPPNAHTTVAADGLKISPADKHGNCWCHIIKSLGTNMISCYPCKEKSDASAVDALLQHLLLFGPFKYLQTDPGSDYTSNLVREFNRYIGIEHHIGLVGRPQSTGIERDVQEIKRFLKDVARDSVLIQEWSAPRVLAVCQYLINNDPELPVNISPSQLTFGKRDPDVYRLIQEANPLGTAAEHASAYHRRLLEELQAINAVYSKHKAERALKSTESNLLCPQNMYQAGDFVFKTIAAIGTGSTFTARRLGPYEVMGQQGNNVAVKNLVDGSPRAFHVEACVLFAGSREDAVRLARHDDNQYAICEILGWRGDPDKRGSLSFLVLFETGEEVWMLYTSDVSHTSELHAYCALRPSLRHLSTTQRLANAAATALNRQGTQLTKGQAVLLDIRFLGHLRYQLRQLELPNKYSTRYLVHATATVCNKTKTDLRIPALDITVDVTRSSLERWVQISGSPEGPDPVTIVTPEFIKLHPSIRTAQLPKHYEALSEEEANELLDPYA